MTHMVDTKQEIERKYEATAEEAGPSGRPDLPGLPELTGAGPVATVVSRGVATLEATYYDTPGSGCWPTPSPCATAPAAMTRAGI
ncbi:hypothetical protein SVIO_042260 [Streptomyces violaceusniger]|uniref:Uncharacterized protein n=1 Tax=Streptomyces violaceusniger TaxID=68280 RepID=A0A4D4L6H1_STRVO|nr:hypothetical protein SVIO_042260 [Streptomyces violaceusniger]